MTTLDVVILLGLAGAAIGGYRIGFLTRVASWVVMAVGILVAARSLTPLLRSLEGADEVTLLLVALGTLLAGAFLGQAVGLVLGSRLHLALPTGSARSVDRGAGAAAGVLGVLIGVWLLLPTMANVPGWTAEQARASVFAGFVHDRFPAPPDTLQALRRLVGEDQFPRVFEALDRAPDLGPPPPSSGIPQAVADSVVPSTVTVRGAACRRIQEGSGFVVGPDLVVTNAHVVAGEDTTTVVRSDGSEVAATAVAFDPNRDLALLRAPGLGRAALPLGDIAPGGIGGVFGHPGGGPLEISAFQVGEEVTADGRDIYDRNRTERRVLILASELAPGDSGGALVDPTGRVVGVAFAIAPDRPGVAYALAIEELQAVLNGGIAPDGFGVETGPCLV